MKCFRDATQRSCPALRHQVSREAATLLLAACGLLVSPASAQTVGPTTITLRAGGAFHVAGLGLSIDPSLGLGSRQLWRHRVQPAMSFGMSASTAFGHGALGLRLDVDHVPRAGLRRDPEGPPLVETPSGRSAWISASLWTAPRFVCSQRCLRLSAGAGRGWYNYAAAEVRGDIGSWLAPKQHRAVARLGLDVRLPIAARRLAVEVADYFARLDPGYSGERLSPIHTLVVSAGVVAGRTSSR